MSYVSRHLRWTPEGSAGWRHCASRFPMMCLLGTTCEQILVKEDKANRHLREVTVVQGEETIQSREWNKEAYLILVVLRQNFVQSSQGCDEIGPFTGVFESSQRSFHLRHVLTVLLVGGDEWNLVRHRQCPEVQRAQISSPREAPRRYQVIALTWQLTHVF